MRLKSSQITTNLGFLATLLILCSLFASCLISARSFWVLKEARKVARERTMRLSEVWIAVESAESAQRGYLLTDNVAYLAPFASARQQSTQSLAGLSELFPSEHPAQQSIFQLEGVLTSKFDEMSETVRLSQQGDKAAALAIVKSDFGEHLTHAAHAIYIMLRDACEHDLERLRNDAEVTLKQGFWTVGCACVFAILALSAAIGVVNADLAKRRHIEVELRAANQAAQQATATKSMFLATMSHELRTPLNAICGMSDLLLEGALAPEPRKFAEVVARSANTLLNLVNDILDFSKIEAGKLELEQKIFATTPMFVAQLDIVRNIAESKGIELRQDIDANMPRLLRGDPGRIAQIVLNLLSNALKFTHTGAVTARFLAQPGSDLHTCDLRIEVIDTGIGLSEEQMKRLFRPFSQVHATSQIAYGGTGLGLAICRQLADLMGGDLGVQSNPQGGSTFWVALRLGVPEAEPAAAVPVDALAAAADRALLQADRPQRHILVAEDNAVNQLLISKQLERLGYQTRIVGNGTEALAALAEKSYDLVLMDCQMPEMDGYEAARRIRAQELQTGQHIPIVALTASAIRGDAERCAAAGMDGHLTKPVNRDLLAQTIKSWIGKRA